MLMGDSGSHPRFIQMAQAAAEVEPRPAVGMVRGGVGTPLPGTPRRGSLCLAKTVSHVIPALRLHDMFIENQCLKKSERYDRFGVAFGGLQIGC